MLRDAVLASLTTIFKNDATDTHEADKLVDLFRNRAELKKEFAALRNEKYELQDRVKHHQGATARVQQQLQHLESLLLDPDWMYNVVAFYQFRALSLHCQKQVIRFAEELKQQREKRAHCRVLDGWKEEIAREAGDLEKRVGERRVELQMLEDKLLSAQQALTTMGGFKKLISGRSAEAEIAEIENGIEVAHHKEQELLRELETLDQREPPDHEGLDMTTKRSINFMILAFAQQLYLHYEEDGLVQLAKEASEKSVGAINYGSKKDCDVLLKRLEQRMTVEGTQADSVAVLRKRSKLISDNAQFRHDDDAVPIPATVSTVFAVDANEVVHRSDANLLGHNYFGIAKVLSR